MAEEQNVEKQAEAMGWTPKEKWRGDPEKWVDAAEFVERGEHVIPILTANQKKLLSQLAERDAKIGGLEGVVSELTKSVELLQKESIEQSRKDFERARRNLLRDRAEARKEGDTDAEVQIDEALAKLEETKPKNGEAPPASKDASKAPPPVPVEVKEWMTRNSSWFGEEGDAALTGAAMAYGQRLAREGKKGKELLEEVQTYMEERFGVNDYRAPTNKVEGGRSGGESRGGGGKSWNDLPQDAKEACDRYGKLLVGPGKKYKTADEHRKQYVKDYFEQ